MEISLQGLVYARPFLSTLRTRWAGLTVTAGRSFYDGPEGLARWSMDGETPFERMRTLDPPPEQRLIAAGLASIGKAYPALRGIAVAQSWGGQVDMTPDAIPVISAVDPLPGLFVSAGFSGHGFGIGPAAGRLAADLVAGDPPDRRSAPLPLQPHDRRKRSRRAWDDVTVRQRSTAMGARGVVVVGAGVVGLCAAWRLREAGAAVTPGRGRAAGVRGRAARASPGSTRAAKPTPRLPISR